MLDSTFKAHSVQVKSPHLLYLWSVWCSCRLFYMLCCWDCCLSVWRFFVFFGGLVLDIRVGISLRYRIPIYCFLLFDNRGDILKLAIQWQFMLVLEYNHLGSAVFLPYIFEICFFQRHFNFKRQKMYQNDNILKRTSLNGTKVFKI